jgi:hypothetical protein
MSEKVPWTDPGGTPCCCIGDCYTDLDNEFDAPATTGEWLDLSATSYANILAGGEWSIASLNIDILWTAINTFPPDTFTLFTLECDLEDIAIG